MKNLPAKNLFMLFLTAFIWGTAFVAQAVGMDHIGPFTFNAARSFVGGVALIPVILVFNHFKSPSRGKILFIASNSRRLFANIFLSTSSISRQLFIFKNFWKAS